MAVTLLKLLGWLQVATVYCGRWPQSLISFGEVNHGRRLPQGCQMVLIVARAFKKCTIQIVINLAGVDSPWNPNLVIGHRAAMYHAVCQIITSCQQILSNKQYILLPLKFYYYTSSQNRLGFQLERLAWLSYGHICWQGMKVWQETSCSSPHNELRRAY